MKPCLWRQPESDLLALKFFPNVFQARFLGKTHIHHFHKLLNKYNAVSLTILKATINIPLRLSLPISYRATSNSGTDLKACMYLAFTPNFSGAYTV